MLAGGLLNKEPENNIPLGYPSLYTCNIRVYLYTQNSANNNVISRNWHNSYESLATIWSPRNLKLDHRPVHQHLLHTNYTLLLRKIQFFTYFFDSFSPVASAMLAKCIPSLEWKGIKVKQSSPRGGIRLTYGQFCCCRAICVCVCVCGKRDVNRIRGYFGGYSNTSSIVGFFSLRFELIGVLNASVRTLTERCIWNSMPQMCSIVSRRREFSMRKENKECESSQK